MTYFHYYATTSRNLDRTVQYVIYPIAHAAGFLLFRNSSDTLKHAADFARVVSAGAYSALTTVFFGLESEMIDANAREAVSAEMGMDNSRIQFSDYKNSQNAIVSKAYDDILRLQKYRYGTDLLFLGPTALQFMSETFAGVKWPRMKHVRDNPNQYTTAEILLNGHNAWDYGVYGAKALYWAGETFAMQKTGHYEVVKLRENIQATGKDVSANDLLSIYQRTRSDRNLPMIDRAEEFEAVRPLFKKMEDAYNKHKGFGTSEIVYLIGLGKINIHAPDNKTVSKEAVEQSSKEIDKVLSIGLHGIREENKQLRAQNRLPQQYASESRHFSDRVADGAFNIAQRIIRSVRKTPQRPEEYITVRDPGELTSFDYSINR